MSVLEKSNTDSNITVLVIDDDRDLLPSLLETITALSDFTVVSADNGALGLERYYEVRPQCVLIDVRMPELDGYQLVHALRGDPETADTPLVILSAMAQEKDRLAGLMAGVDRYLVKPVKPLELIEAIRLAIQMSSEERMKRLRALAEGETDID